MHAVAGWTNKQLTLASVNYDANFPERAVFLPKRSIARFVFKRLQDLGD